MDTDIEVITATNLTKKYSDLVAVDSIDFSVSKGECFGLLGANGAGKTSIMKMACCVSPVTSGDLFVQGRPCAFACLLARQVKKPGVSQ